MKRRGNAASLSERESDVLTLARETMELAQDIAAGPWLDLCDQHNGYEVVRRINGRFSTVAVCGADHEDGCNSAFIAHARTAAPLLAAEVVRLHEAKCGTCRFWTVSDDPTIGRCSAHVTGPGYLGGQTPPKFGCNWHEPLLRVDHGPGTGARRNE